MKEKKILRANAICLEDSEGNPRIMMDAAQPDGMASVAIFSKSGRQSIHLSAQPDDRVEISVRGPGGASNVTIMMMPQSGNASILITDSDGTPAVHLGKRPWREEASEPDVVIYENNRPKHRLRNT